MLKKISWTYQGNRYAIDWVFVFVFVFGSALAVFVDRLRKPYDIVVAVVLIFVGLAWCIYTMVKNSRAEAAEKILYNLSINIHCSRKTFKNGCMRSAEDEIETYGLAIHSARKHLKGSWKVTERGYLIRGFAKDVENRVVEVDINDVGVILGLELLAKVLAEKTEMKNNSRSVHMHFADSGSTVNVIVDEKGLRIK